jgi:hypothetical protein
MIPHPIYTEPEQKTFPLILFLLSGTGLFFQDMREALAAEAESNLNGWPLGDTLLVGILFILALGWFTGLYSLFFTRTAPFVKKVFLYPLLKVIGKGGERKPLTMEKE